MTLISNPRRPLTPEEKRWINGDRSLPAPRYKDGARGLYVASILSRYIRLLEAKARRVEREVS